MLGMIASFEHQFIFIKTRKTAGTAIELVLSSLCGAADIITPIHPDDEKIREAHGWRGPQNFRVGLATVQRADRRLAAEILNERQKKAIYESCRETFELMGYER
jgi:hypothetical protein